MTVLEMAADKAVEEEAAAAATDVSASQNLDTNPLDQSLSTSSHRLRSPTSASI